MIDKAYLKEILSNIEEIPRLDEMAIQTAAAICTLLSYYPAHEHPAALSVSVVDESAESETRWLLDRADSEIHGAEMYCDKWIETRKPEYKQLALDELRHSEVFIKQAQQAGAPQSELQEAIKLHGILMAKLA